MYPTTKERWTLYELELFLSKDELMSGELKKKQAVLLLLPSKTMLYKHLRVKEDLAGSVVVAVVVVVHHGIRSIETTQSVPIVENRDTTNLKADYALLTKERSSPHSLKDPITMKMELALSDELISPSFQSAVCLLSSMMLLF